MAATSKLVAASATYPYQVIRARLQVMIVAEDMILIRSIYMIVHN